MKRYTPDEFTALLREQDLDAAETLRKIAVWHARGDSAAVYENQDLGHPAVGHKQIVSFGSPAAQLEVPEPPEWLPDIGGHINIRYMLVGVYGRDSE